MTKKIEVKGKVVVVSGSNRGIGKAITIELLEQGAKKVYAGARDISSLSELKDKYGEQIVPIELDVTNDATIKEVASATSDVDILINNAGVFAFGTFLGDNLLESLQKNLDVNLWGVVKLTSALLPHLQSKDQAAIANVVSVVGLASMPSGVTYSASKAAVHSITQGLRAELSESKILVSGVYPGPIETDMTKGFDMQMDSPENVAKNVVAGLIAGDEYIFPDAMSKQVGEAYFASPKATEDMFAQWK